MNYFTKYSVCLSICLSFAFHSFLIGADLAATKDPLQRLTEGNKRYVNSATVCHTDWGVKRTALVQGQNPFAVIVSCSDSRVPPEIIFDQSLGDLFVVRLAGNIVDDFAMGSIEYAVNYLGASFIVVLGHAKCGAVEATLKGMKFDDHIQEVVNAIEPAVKEVKGQTGDLLEKAIKANVQRVAEKLKNSKPTLSKFITEGKLKVVGGYYQLETGEVQFL